MPTLNRKQFSLTPKRSHVAGDYDREKMEVYNTKKWRKLRRARLITNPLCENCGKELSEQVHHIDPFMKYQGEERKQRGFDLHNLQALCDKCHRLLHRKNVE
jgi:5-methylcytosine-specific restriction endonuclease McrA